MPEKSACDKKTVFSKYLFHEKQPASLHYQLLGKNLLSDWKSYNKEVAVRIKTISSLFIASIFLAPSAYAFGTTSTRDVVTSSSGEVVTNSFGNCVRTRWDVGMDICNQKTAAAVVPSAPQPQPRHFTENTVSKDDRVIYFAFDKYDLSTEARAKLDSLANVLVSSDNVTDARIVGYADRIGTLAYNDRLSQKRAETVKSYLISRGFVKSSVTQTHWLGKTDPITSCPAHMPRTELINCLQQDRRVQVEIDFTEAPTSK